MAIARNKKNPPVDPAAIEAFGAAAEARAVAQEPKTAAAKPRAIKASNQAGEKAPPLSSLVRWDGEEELRDRLIAYGAAERYKMQALMVKAMQLGMDQLEKR